MPLERVVEVFRKHVAELEEQGRAKGEEAVVTRVIPPSGDRGPRFLLEGQGDREFIRMNSNSYLGMSLRPEIIAAEEEGARLYGAGRGRCASSAGRTLRTSSSSGGWPRSTAGRRG